MRFMKVGLITEVTLVISLVIMYFNVRTKLCWSVKSIRTAIKVTDKLRLLMIF